MSLERKFDDLIALLDQRLESIVQKLTAHDRRFEAIERRFEAIDQRFDSVIQKLAAHDRRFDALEYNLTGREDAVKRLIHLIEGMHDQMELLAGQDIDRRISELERKTGIR